MRVLCSFLVGLTWLALHTCVFSKPRKNHPCVCLIRPIGGTKVRQHHPFLGSDVQQVDRDDVCDGNHEDRDTRRGYRKCYPKSENAEVDWVAYKAKRSGRDQLLLRKDVMAATETGNGDCRFSQAWDPRFSRAFPPLDLHA